MRLDFFMLADGATSPDGKVYIHGGAITRVYPTGFPAATVIASVVRFLIDPEEVGGPPHPVAIEWSHREQPSWRASAETELAPQEPPMGFREGEDIGVVIVAPMLIAFEQPGSYEVSVRLDGDVVSIRRIYVTSVDDPEHPRPPVAPPADALDPETPEA